MKIHSMIEISALVFFVIWGYFISIEDLKTNKVPNKKIIMGLRLFFIFLIAQASNTVLGKYGYLEVYLDNAYFYHLFLNMALATMGGIILWYAEIWPAGDAKFFITSVSLMPLAVPGIAGFPGYLWLSVLVNTFVIASIYAVARFLYESYRMKLNGDNDAFKEFRDFKEKVRNFFAKNSGKSAAQKIITMFFSLGVIFLAKQVLNMYLMGLLGRSISKAYIIYFLLFFGWEKASVFFQKKIWKITMWVLYFLYFLAGMLFFRDEVLMYVSKAISNVFTFSIILASGRFFLEYLIEKKNAYWVSSKEIKEGMILSSSSINSIRSNDEIARFFEDYHKDGIDRQQVEVLSSWLSKIDKGNGKLEMVRGYPFAFWIYLGCISLFIFNKSILSLIKI